MSDLFRRNSDRHLQPLRNTSRDLKLSKKATNNGQDDLNVKVLKSWNARPLEIKKAPSLQAFTMKQNQGFPIESSISYLL